MKLIPIGLLSLVNASHQVQWHLTQSAGRPSQPRYYQSDRYEQSRYECGPCRQCPRPCRSSSSPTKAAKPNQQGRNPLAKMTTISIATSPADKTSESVEGNWCDEIVGTKNETKREKTSQTKLVAVRCQPYEPRCRRQTKRVPIYREITVQVPQVEKRCCVGYTGDKCLERVEVQESSSQSSAQVEKPELGAEFTCDLVDTCTADIRQELTDLARHSIESLVGSAGPKGPKGDQGRAGRDGVDGEPGFRGETGPQGPPGLAGPQGAQGLPGRDGLPGEPGQDGQKGEPGVCPVECANRGPTPDDTSEIDSLKAQINSLQKTVSLLSETLKKNVQTTNKLDAHHEKLAKSFDSLSEQIMDQDLRSQIDDVKAVAMARMDAFEENCNCLQVPTMPTMPTPRPQFESSGSGDFPGDDEDPYDAPRTDYTNFFYDDAVYDARSFHGTDA